MVHGEHIRSPHAHQFIPAENASLESARPMKFSGLCELICYGVVLQTNHGVRAPEEGPQGSLYGYLK
jgi:hypothetical protein